MYPKTSNNQEIVEFLLENDVEKAGETRLGEGLGGSLNQNDSGRKISVILRN